MITIQDLEIAYKDSTESSRVTLAEGLRNEKGEKLNVLYSTILRLSKDFNRESKSNYNVNLIGADGGIQEFTIQYLLRDYFLNVALVNRFNCGFASSPEELAQHLNKTEQAILSNLRMFIYNHYYENE